MKEYVNSGELYQRMIEKGITTSRITAVQMIRRCRRDGRLVYPDRPNNRMRFKESWIDDIIFNLFDPKGKGNWSVYDYE